MQIGSLYWKPQPRHSISRERAVRADVESAMASNAKSFGRQVYRQVDSGELSGKKPSGFLAPFGTPAKTVEKPAPETAPRSEAPKEASQEEKFTALMESVMGVWGAGESVKITTEALERGREDGGNEVEPYIARVVLERAEQCSEPEKVAGLRSLAQDFLKGSEFTPGGGEGVAEPAERGESSVVKNARMMAENHQTLDKIAEIYAQMVKDREESQMKIHQIWQETMKSINEMWLETRKRREEYNAKHFATFLDILRGAV